MTECIFDSTNTCVLMSCFNVLMKDKYCLEMSTNKIYKGINDDNNGSCEIAYGNSIDDEGILIFDVTFANNTVQLDPTNITPDNNFVLMDCGYGECIQTFGYVQSGGKVYECNYSGSREISVSDINSCDQSNLGKVTYSSGNGFQICINDANDLTTFTMKAIDGSDTLVIKPDGTTGTFANESFNSPGILKMQNNIVAFTSKSIYIYIYIYFFFFNFKNIFFFFFFF